MLPPVDISTLHSNPHFAALYKRLTTSKLNTDGSIKLSPEEARSQCSTEQDLRTTRTALAKSSLLRSALPRLLASDLPDDLLDLLTFLNSPTPLPLDLLPFLTSTTPAPLGPLLSPHLHALASSLLLLAANSPTSQFPPQHSPPPSIPARRAALAAAEARLHVLHIALAPALAQLLATHRAVLVLGIRALESQKHGTVARAVGAEVTYLSAVAEGMDAKLAVLLKEAYVGVYDEGVRSAVGGYRKNLGEWREGLEGREGRAAGEVELLEEGVGEEVRGVWVRLRREREVVQGEIERLVRER